MELIEAPVSELIAFKRRTTAPLPGKIHEIAKSLQKYGQVRPIVVTGESKRTVLCGNSVVEAARSVGMRTLFCVYLSNHSDSFHAVENDLSRLGSIETPEYHAYLESTDDPIGASVCDEEDECTDDEVDEFALFQLPVNARIDYEIRRLSEGLTIQEIGEAIVCALQKNHRSREDAESSVSASGSSG